MRCIYFKGGIFSQDFYSGYSCANILLLVRTFKIRFKICYRMIFSKNDRGFLFCSDLLKDPFRFLLILSNDNRYSYLDYSRFSAAICSSVSPRICVWSNPIFVMTDSNGVIIFVESNLPPRPTSIIAISTFSLLK